MAGPLRSLFDRAGPVAGLLGKCRMLAVGCTLPCVVVTFWEQYGKSLVCYSKQFVSSFRCGHHKCCPVAFFVFGEVSRE